MKTERNILIAFILNIIFSAFELIGGLITGSISILSDSLHDLGDAFSILISYFLEKKSKRKVDLKYTYGYVRYSVMGGIITSTILLVGSILMYFTNICYIDSILSIIVSLFILINALKNIKLVVDLFLEKTPNNIDVKKIKQHILKIDGVCGVHHINV